MAKPKAGDEERGARLAQARVRAGFAKLVDAEKRYDLKSTYAQHESGLRGFGIDEAAIYAKRYQVNFEWLCTGRGDPAGTAWQIADAFMRADSRTKEIVAGILKIEAGGDKARPPDQDRSSASAPAHVEQGAPVSRRLRRGAGD